MKKTVLSRGRLAICRKLSSSILRSLVEAGAIIAGQGVAQALSGGHSIKSEVSLLTVHGILHLLGYDHADDATKHEMWTEQQKILAALGCEITGPPNHEADTAP